MKAKYWVPIVIVVVAVAAFVLGRQFSGVSQPPEEPEMVEEATPPAVAEQTPAPPPAQPVAPRRRRAETPAQPAPPSAEPEAPAAEAKPSESMREPEPPPPPPQPVKVRLAEGTKIFFTLNKALSTKTNQTGDAFSGVVSRSVRVGTTLVIPEGSVLRGTVGHVERAGRVKGRSELGLRFDELELPDGETYDISASLSDLGAGKGSVTEEGGVKGEGSKTRDVATIGGGAGIGAVIGAISGGGKGAATGGAIGAGAGTAMVLLTRGKDVELKRGTELAIQLDRPMAVAVK